MPMIDLATFGDGAVAERFNLELKRILENIADPNTDPKKARKLTLSVTLKADDKRDIASVAIEAKTSLVPAKGIETRIVMDYDNNGNVIGSELKSGAKGQLYIDPTDSEVKDDRGNKVIDLKASAK